MVRQRLLPLATAVALTLAAGLSIAEEHARSHAAAPDASLAVPARQGASVDNGAASQPTGDAAATRSTAVGSRALIGDETEGAKKAPMPHPAHYAPEPE